MVIAEIAPSKLEDRENNPYTKRYWNIPALLPFSRLCSPQYRRVNVAITDAACCAIVANKKKAKPAFEAAWM
jgi:hypothetical protein